MDLNEYVQKADGTDQIDSLDQAVRIGLLGIAGEAGSIVSEAKKWFREDNLSEGLRDRIREDLGDLLWYVALLARRLEIDLDQVLEDNLKKTHELWAPDSTEMPSYDDHDWKDQKLLRRMSVRFEEDRSSDLPVVRMVPLGELAERIGKEKDRKEGVYQLGNDLDDNAAVEDGYRYHDVIHLAHATVLGWSPVLRSLMGAKRKHDLDLDRIQDGARAIAIEEGLAAFVFNYLEPHDFSTVELDWNLFRHIRRTVKGLEVATQPISAWKSAYSQAFTILLKLRNAKGGVVECDLNARELTFVAGG